MMLFRFVSAARIGLKACKAETTNACSVRPRDDAASIVTVSLSLDGEVTICVYSMLALRADIDPELRFVSYCVCTVDSASWF